MQAHVYQQNFTISRNARTQNQNAEQCYQLDTLVQNYFAFYWPVTVYDENGNSLPWLKGGITSSFTLVKTSAYKYLESERHLSMERC